ncbi:MAG: NADH-quinone oxidoreductase subunit J, partial [Acidimicrobiales bacterium]
SEFTAVTQVLVYIGAIVVLFLFGIMLTRGSLGDDQLSASERRGMGGLVAALLFGIMAFALIDGFEDTVLAADTRNLVEVDTPIDTDIDDDKFVRVRRGSDTAAIGDTIFEQYIIPFEAISVLLLAALIGAIVIARKE